MARRAGKAYHQDMAEDEKIEALKAALAAMRQKRQDWVTKRINLKMSEVHELDAKILEEEDALRHLGVTDA